MTITLGKIKNNAKTTKKQNQTRKGYILGSNILMLEKKM